MRLPFVLLSPSYNPLAPKQRWFLTSLNNSGVLRECREHIAFVAGSRAEGACRHVLRSSLGTWSLDTALVCRVFWAQ